MPWLALAGFNLTLAFAYGLPFLALVPLALAGAVFQWKLNGSLSLNRSVTGLVIGGDGLQVQQRSGEGFTARAAPASRIYPRLVILKLTPTGAIKRPSTLLVLAGQPGTGNVCEAQHRRLRAWLQLGAAEHPA
jgi:toxin CptA